MRRNSVTEKDRFIWLLLKDHRYQITPDGNVLRQLKDQSWRLAGWVSPSRNGTKLYRRLEYMGVQLYEHRIVWAASRGFLSSLKTINHKDLNGLNNKIENLELITPSQNQRHAKTYYRRAGMSAIEAKANWAKGQVFSI